jgi:hypothetical protein
LLGSGDGLIACISSAEVRSGRGGCGVLSDPGLGIGTALYKVVEFSGAGTVLELDV